MLFKNHNSHNSSFLNRKEGKKHVIILNRKEGSGKEIQIVHMLTVSMSSPKMKSLPYLQIITTYLVLSTFSNVRKYGFR